MAALPPSPVATETACEPRKHSKTFTGCWTCRSRKIKCDEARPSCLQCRTRSLHCEGYFVRLQWIPSTGRSLNSRTSSSSHQLPKANLQRSQIAHDSVGQSLEPSKIDKILYSIDSYESSLDSFSRASSPLFIHNFGVFDLTPIKSSPGPSSSTNFTQETPSTFNSDENVTLATTIDDQLYASSTTHSIPGLSDSVYDETWDLNNCETQLPESFDYYYESSSTSPLWSEGADPVLHSSQEHGSQEDQRQREKNTQSVLPQYCQWREPSGVIISNPSPASLPEQEQFLMYHYSNRVVNLFCVIDNRKSPWKTIHLPRALQSIGQLNVTGSSSSIRNALRKSLLSISAFYLSNDSKQRRCPDEVKLWTRKATMLRGQAIKLLKDAVNNDFNNKSVPKYKEFLATMLSMITINVMSGDTSTCGMHLDGALRFITQARTWKTKYSPKARALHRIYFYLRAIYESTAVDYEDTPYIPRTSTFDLLKPSRLMSSSDAANLSADACPEPVNPTIPEPGMLMNTYECIYGVPQNLLVLLSRSSGLVREVTSFRKEKGRIAFPIDLSSRCDDLEQIIMDWPIKLELERCCIDGMGASSDIIRQTTHAFHNALIIYFAQHIRLLSYRYLQSYVQSVLESIEAIEKIKSENNILAAPIYWPAFIAASEAFNENLQSRIKSWYDQVEVYGIEAPRAGTSVLTEVWARGPATGNELTSRWRTIVEATGCHLMLT